MRGDLALNWRIKMTATKFADVIGYWNDRTSADETFLVGIAVVPPDTGDEDVDRLLDRDNVFFVLTSDEIVVGNHGEFTITECHPAGE